MKVKLTLGLGCNMKCPYCYQLGFHDKTKEMSYETLDAFLEKFNKIETPDNYINFFGGEPLLYKDKIKYVIERIKHKDKCDISITTNALDREGFYEIQEMWGKPIYNQLSNKEHRDYRRLNEVSTFRWVVTKENIKELTDDLVEFLGKEYMYGLHFMYDMTQKWEEKEVARMKEIEILLKKTISSKFEMELPIDTNRTKKQCVGNFELTIDYNGDFLYCHRNRNIKYGKNIKTDDFIQVAIPNCIAMQSTKFENFYHYDIKYKYMSANLFSG